MNIKNITNGSSVANAELGRTEQRLTKAVSVESTRSSVEDQAAVKLSGLEDPEQRAKRVQDIASRVDDGSYIKNLDTRAVAEKVALDLFA